ncbi:MAG: enoyl-CoA hydratase/isomerase family protein [Thermoguttaceae bacterium]
MSNNTHLAPILFSRRSPEIAEWTFNRPDSHNAFSGRMLEEVAQCLENIENDPQIRVLVLQGNGPTFCAGIDLKEAATNSKTAFSMFEKMVRFVARLRRLPFLVLSSAHGSAIGGGSAMLAASDMVLLDSQTQVASPDVRRGFEPLLFFPLFRRKLNDAALRQFLLTGLPLDAFRAKEIGLAQVVVEPNQRAEVTLKWAKQLCEGERNAVMQGKQLLAVAENTTLGITLEEELDLSLQSHFSSWNSPTAREGVAAFLEKRQPVF